MRTPTSAARNGDYAANVEAVAVRAAGAAAYDDVPAAHVEDTPDTPTIETLVDAARTSSVPARRPALARPRTR